MNTHVLSSAAAVAIFSGLFTFGLARPAAAQDDPLITQARATLYTNRDQSLTVMEDALAAHPENTAYWVEYLRMVGGSFADRASLHALKLHPHDPDLLITRARLHGDGVGLEALAELAKLPGRELQAARLSDLTRCELTIPDTDPWPADTYARLADRLLELGKPDVATAHLQTALKTITDRPPQPLFARQAILAALDGKFDQALQLNQSAGGMQVTMENTYHGLADALLAKGKPDLVLGLFPDNPPAPDDLRRILAMAKARSNDFDGALKLLAGDKMDDQLLRCRVLLLAKRPDDALALGQQITAPMHEREGSYAGPWASAWAAGPRSLMDDSRAVILWLNQQVPRQRAGIAYELGTGTEKLSAAPRGWTPVESVTLTLAQMDAWERGGFNGEFLGLAPLPPGPAREQQSRISHASLFAHLGRYADATALLAAPLPTGYHPSLYDAAQLDLLRRSIEATVASDKDYAPLAAARPAIARIDAACFQSSGKPLQFPAQDVKTLVAIGPAVLGDVLTQLGSNVISGQDRTPWVSVIAELGAPSDAPVLIATLKLVTRGEPYTYPQNEANDRATAVALDACLQKLTSANPAGADRGAAWSAWLTENAPAIFSAK